MHILIINDEFRSNQPTVIGKPKRALMPTRTVSSLRMAQYAASFCAFGYESFLVIRNLPEVQLSVKLYFVSSAPSHYARTMGAPAEEHVCHIYPAPSGFQLMTHFLIGRYALKSRNLWCKTAEDPNDFGDPKKARFVFLMVFQKIEILTARHTPHPKSVERSAGQKVKTL